MKQDWADETEDRMDSRAPGEDFDLLERTETITYSDKRQVTHKVYYRLVEVMEREYLGVAARRDNWVPFGRAANSNSAQLWDPAEKVEFTLVDPDAVGTTGVITHAEKIVQKDLAELERAIKFELTRSSQKDRAMAQVVSATVEEAATPSPKAGVFKARTDATSTRPTGSAEVSSLRIDNLSSDTTEEALRVLCNRMGNVTKLYVPMNKNPTTGEKKCKGFAFVTFNRQSDAEAAKQKLHRLPFMHSVLSVSWGTKTNVAERPARK